MVNINSFYCRWLLVAAAASIGASAAEMLKAGELNIEPYLFRTESGQSVEAELGRLVVPQNRSDPESALTTIAFVRFRSTSDRPGAPVLYLAGGPGASGIDDARGNLFTTITALQAVGDVLVIDQRGTGMSTPDLNVHASLGVAAGDSLASGQALAALETAFRKASGDLAEAGITLAAYNTNESADDLDSLRATLGIDRVRLWAHSYGTHLALAFIRRHESAVDMVIMGGINGPDHRWRLPSDPERVFSRLNVLLQADSRWAGRIPDLAAFMRQVLSGLADNPVQVPVRVAPDRSVVVTLGKEDIQVLTAVQLGDIDFIRAIPALFFEMANGEYSRPAAMMLGLKGLEIGSAVRYSMHCASGVSVERQAVIDSEKQTALLGNAINFPFDQPRICEAWRTGDLGPEYRTPVRSAVRALFVTATLDGRTSLEDAAEVRTGFPNSTTVVLENSSHGRMFSASPQLTRVMVDFFSGAPVADQTIVLPFSFQ